MQKQRKLVFLVFVLLIMPDVGGASIVSLPRYQGSYSVRAEEGDARSRICSPSYKYSCDGAGELNGFGESCNGLYKSCRCTSHYKWSGGKCVELACEDYHYLSRPNEAKSCVEVEPQMNMFCYECSSCDENIYKHDCKGNGYASAQEAIYKCGDKYSQCACSGAYSWSADEEKCVCNGTDVIEENNDEGQKICRLKECSDYGYLDDNEEDIYDGLVCSDKRITRQYGEGKTDVVYCYDCNCDAAYKYDCAAGSNTHILKGDGYPCKNNKYKACICDSSAYWENGSCQLNCQVKACTGFADCVDEGGNPAKCTITSYSDYSVASSINYGTTSFTKCIPERCGGGSQAYGYRATACRLPYILRNGICVNEAGCEYYGYYTTKPSESYYSCSTVSLTSGDCFDCYNRRDDCIQFFGGNVSGGFQPDGPDVDSGWVFTITNPAILPAADTFDFDYKDNSEATAAHTVFLGTDATIFGDVTIRNANLVSSIWQYVDWGVDDCKKAEFSDLMDLNGVFTVVNDKYDGFVTPEINAANMVLEGKITFLNRVYADNVVIKAGSTVKFSGGLQGLSSGTPEVRLEYGATIDFGEEESDVLKYRGLGKLCQAKVTYSTFEELQGTCPKYVTDSSYWYWKETENTANVLSCRFKWTADTYQCGVSVCNCDGTYGSANCDKVEAQFNCQ